jgi:2-methylisocitrate lyase-like PEP mutase family enzyme
MPDLGLVTMNDMLDNAAMIASLDRSTPVIADADTGYGGPVMVARTVKSYIAAGVAGMHLEDQVQSKRCGHLLGKQIVDEETFLSRIKAAVMARDEMKATIGDAGDIVLIARTDALQVAGFAEAARRLQKAVEIGADVAFLEGPTSVEQCRSVCEKLAPAPVLLNRVAGGVTPDFTASEAKEARFKIVIFPGLMLSAVLESCSVAATELKNTGTVRLTERQKKEGPKGLFNVCGLAECTEFDKKAGGRAFSNGV